MTAAYYGGILASSRSGVLRDDRGASFTSLVGRLTTYQLRAHYVLYTALYDEFQGESYNLHDSKGRVSCGLFVPFVDYLQAMEIEPGEDGDVLISHALFGLQSENLIENNFAYGNSEILLQYYKDCPETDSGIVFRPSVLGIELFLWATGNSGVAVNDTFRADLEVAELDVMSCDNACRIQRSETK